jgi:hypothetical protein
VENDLELPLDRSKLSTSSNVDRELLSDEVLFLTASRCLSRWLKRDALTFLTSEKADRASGGLLPPKGSAWLNGNAQDEGHVGRYQGKHEWIIRRCTGSAAPCMRQTQVLHGQLSQ